MKRDVLVALLCTLVFLGGCAHGKLYSKPLIYAQSCSSTSE